MKLTADQVRTLARLVSYDQAPGVELRTVRGEIVIRWRDKAGIEARMVLTENGRVQLPRKVRRG